MSKFSCSLEFDGFDHLWPGLQHCVCQPSGRTSQRLQLRSLWEKDCLAKSPQGVYERKPNTSLLSTKGYYDYKDCKTEYVLEPQNHMWRPCHGNPAEVPHKTEPRQQGLSQGVFDWAANPWPRSGPWSYLRGKRSQSKDQTFMNHPWCGLVWLRTSLLRRLFPSNISYQSLCKSMGIWQASWPG